MDERTTLEQALIVGLGIEPTDPDRQQARAERQQARAERVGVQVLVITGSRLARTGVRPEPFAWCGVSTV